MEGVKEINLIAQSLTSYGLDWKKKDELPKLLKRLSRVDGIRWIRLFYAYPTDLTDELIDLIAAEEKICSYVDLPLQHIDDDILKKMRRKGDSRLIRSLLNKLQSRIQNLFMRTTFIVGFPERPRRSSRNSWILWATAGSTASECLAILTKRGRPLMNSPILYPKKKK
jgi:ribosomal protein S12 methylthiotransferase